MQTKHTNTIQKTMTIKRDQRMELDLLCGLRDLATELLADARAVENALVFSAERITAAARSILLEGAINLVKGGCSDLGLDPRLSINRFAEMDRETLEELLSRRRLWKAASKGQIVERKIAPAVVKAALFKTACVQLEVARIGLEIPAQSRPDIALLLREMAELTLCVEPLVGKAFTLLSKDDPALQEAGAHVIQVSEFAKGIVRESLSRLDIEPELLFESLPTLLESRTRAHVFKSTVGTSASNQPNLRRKGIAPALAHRANVAAVPLLLKMSTAALHLIHSGLQELDSISTKRRVRTGKNQT